MQRNITDGDESTENWLRKSSIQDATPMAKSVLCNVIIDGDSFEDVVSTQMVEMSCLFNRATLNVGPPFPIPRVI